MKCPDTRPCFAQDAVGNCEILTDTLFTRACPFYKPAKSIDDNTEFTIAGYEGRFKKIKGYDYVISTEGVVLNKVRKPVKPTLDKGKYELRITLRHNGKSRHFTIIALMGAAFLPGEGKIVHKNGDRNDCRLENLERR